MRSRRRLGARLGSRHAHPYHLAYIHGHWYLFAHDVNRKAIRTFALKRLAKARVTEERFVKPRGFDPDKYLAGSFTVMKGDKEEVVEVEFDAWGDGPGAREGRSSCA